MKRYLSLLLALLMVFSLLPVSALADGEVPEEPTEALEEVLPAEEPAEEALPEAPAEELTEVPVEEILPEEEALPEAPAEPEEALAEEALPEEQPLSEELSEFVLLAKPASADNILTLDFIPNEAFLHALIGKFGNELLLRDAEVITELNLHGCGIADLTGIAYFIGLEVLDVSNNALTSLDVGGFKCLKTLNCSGNAITALKMGGHTVLENLDCSNNAFTDLNVGSCKSLKSLNCSGNSITALGIGGCKYIETLNCSNNALTALDVPGSLRNLDCSGNSLIALDLSGTDIKTLYCSNNALTSLTGLSGNVYLDYLDCRSNALTALDLSGTGIRTLDCGNNALTELKGLSGDVYLNSLDCSNNSLTALDLSGTDIKTLYCGNNALTSLTGLSGNVYLDYLDCRSNALTALDVSGSDIFTLNCSGNALTALDVSNCRYLWNLDCSSNALTALDLSGCPALSHLVCGGNKLADLNLKELPLRFFDCDLGTQYLDEPVGAVVLPRAEAPAEPYSVAVLEVPATGRLGNADAEECWEAIDGKAVRTEGTPDRCVYAVAYESSYSTLTMLISCPVEYVETTIGMGSDYILIDFDNAPVELGLTLKDPEADSEAIKKLMNQGLLTVEITAYDADNPEECTVVELDEYDHRMVAPKAVGTAYVDVNLVLGETFLQTYRVRVDVVDTVSAEEVLQATLPVKTATVNLYSTDYLELDVLLDLRQWHEPNDPSLLDYVLPDPESFPDHAGVAIWKAEFTDAEVNGMDLNDMFILVPVSDRRLVVIPHPDYVKAVYESTAPVPKKVSSTIELTLCDGEGYLMNITTEQALTLTLKTTQPKLKAAAVKFNSLLNEEKLLAITDGEVLAATVISAPEWAEFGKSGQGFTLRYAGAAGAKLSGSVALDCTVKGWAVTVPVTVKLNASAVKPKITFTKKSITFVAGTRDSAVVVSKLSPAVFAEDWQLLSVIDTATKQPVEPDGYTVPKLASHIDRSAEGTGAVVLDFKAPVRSPDGKTHSYKFTFSAGGATAAVTVKVLPETAPVTLTLKTAGYINTALPISTVTVTPTLKNVNKNPDGSPNAWLRLNFECVFPDGSREPADDCLFIYEEKPDIYDDDLEAIPAGPLHVLAGNLPGSGCTYYANVEAVNALGDTLATAKVKIPVQVSSVLPALKVKLSGKLDPQRVGREVKVSVTAANCLPLNNSLQVEVYKVFDGATGKKTFENASDLFYSSHRDEEEGSYGGFTLRLAEGVGGQIHPKDKFSLQIGLLDIRGVSLIMEAKPVSLPVTMGKAALKLAPAKADMPLGDPYAETKFAVTWADPALRGISRVELAAASNKLFDLTANPDGTYALHWDNNKCPTTLKSGKTVSVKLNVWLQGNEFGKPTTLTLKVTVR